MTARRYRHLLCATMLATGIAGVAQAQSTTDPAANSNPGAPQAADESGNTIPDIIVTANKREENAQRVAGDIMAISQASITRQGVKNITDITRAFSDVSVSGGANLNAISIRGVGSLAFGPTTESPSAVHIDGAYISRLTGLQGLFYDVQRVEVLAGPQGTLYGRNSAGGTLNIITNKPSQELGGYGSIEVGNYDTVTANAALNVPLTSTLAARVAYYHTSNDGYYDNQSQRTNLNSFRASLLWKPTDADTLLVTADLQRIRGQTRNGAEVLTQVIKNPTILAVPGGGLFSVPAGTPGGVVVPILASVNRHDGTTVLGALDQNRQTTDTGGYMAQYDHDFGWATLTAQASYRYVHYGWSNGSLTGYRQDGRLTATGVIRPTSPNSFENGDSQANTQEIRLVSPNNKPITYVIGAFRYYEKTYNNALGSYQTNYSTTPGSYGQLSFPNPPVLSLDIANPLQTDEAYAVFGQATWSPMGPVGLHVTGGVRYNTEVKDSTSFTILGGACQQPILPPGAPVSQCTGNTGHINNHRVTYKANVSYDLTDRNLIYADTSTGFAAGGFSFGVSPQYGANTITAYEIGSKNRFFNNKVLFNISAWHYNYHDLPAIIGLFYFDTINFPMPQLRVSPTTTTAPRAKVDGQTASLTFAPTRDDTFVASATHNNARFTDFNLYPAYAQAVGAGLFPGATAADYNYAGSKIGLTYDWAANGSYDHVFHLGDGALDAQASVHYAGARLLMPLVALADTNNSIFSKPLATVDFSLGYSPPSRRWNITAYVRNIVDARVSLAEAYNAGGAGANVSFLPASDPRVFYAYRTVSYTPPRTFGVIARLDF